MEEKSITRNIKKDSILVSIIQYGGLSSENRIISSKGIPIDNIEKINIKNNNKSNLTDERIRLLTYNFFCRPPPINTNKDDYKDSRLKDFIDQLKNFDIICFQELFTTLNDRKHRMIREGATQGLKYYLTPKVPSFFSKYLVDSGLLILSRYPIIEHDFYEYFLNVSGDATTNKGVLFAKIEIKKNKFLFLFNTHLQASYFDDTQANIDFTIKVRAKQTEELINFIYNILLKIPQKDVENGKIILAGDFNIDAHDNKFARERYKIPKYNDTEYNIFKEKINKLGKAIDLMKKKYNDHIYTFGNNEKKEYDHVLTGKADLNIKQTLDYIWEIIPDYNLSIFKSQMNIFNDNIENNEINNNNNGKIEVNYDSLKVQEFLIKDSPYQQLSDHFGVSVELSY